MTGDGTVPASASRRRMLKWMAFAAVGAGVALLGLETLLGSSTSGSGESSLGGAASASSSSELVERLDSSPVKVKVMYFQMPQYVDTQEEYFVLQSPAYVGGLLKDIAGKHPALSTMWPSTMILVDGVSASTWTALKNDDEVYLIPAIAGG